MYAEVAEVAEEGRQLAIAVDAHNTVETAVAECEAWSNKARRLLAKRNSGQRLLSCIEFLSDTLERAQEQLTLCLQVDTYSPPFAVVKLKSPWSSCKKE